MTEEVSVELRDPAKQRRVNRPRSASYIALRSAVYQLTRLNDFATEKIGSGFYADVFKVKHTTTGEVMVLKMNKSRKNSKTMLSEIQLLNRLSHTNILGFRGSCVHEGQLHALTEYINGGSLEDLLLNRLVDLSWSVKVKIARDIASGMAYLHAKGVFHRDLTSRNCLIQHLPDGQMRAVVADFGLAAKIKYERRRSFTEVVGSPYWMAPECLRGKQYCEKADIFSYGIILAEIMARIPADPDFMPRTNTFGMDLNALRKLCGGCPEEMWTLMSQCCQLDPDDRPTFIEASCTLDAIPLEPVDLPDSDVRSCCSEPILRSQESISDITCLNLHGDREGVLAIDRRLDSLGSAESNSSSGSLDGVGFLSGSGGGAGLVSNAMCDAGNLPREDMTGSEVGVSRSQSGAFHLRFLDSGLSVPPLVRGGENSSIEEEAEPRKSFSPPPPWSPNGDLTPISSRNFPSSPLNPNGTQSLLTMEREIAEEDEEEENTTAIGCGDSGIDPGETLSITPSHVAASEKPTSGREEDVFEKTRASEGWSLRGRLIREESCDSSAGDRTPVCTPPLLPPSHPPAITPSAHAHQLTTWQSPTSPSHPHTSTLPALTPSMDADRTILGAESPSSHDARSSPSPTFVTPVRDCASPFGRGWEQDSPIRLPSPSTPWAPPPSPSTPGFLYHSLPSSPLGGRRFRYSQEIPEDQILTDFRDSPEPFRRSGSVRSGSLRLQRRLSPLHHGGAKFPDPLHSRTTHDPMYYTQGGADLSEKHRSLCTNLDEEHFSSTSSALPRNRSHSNPAPPVRKQSVNYALMLSRASTDGLANSTSSFCKCYSVGHKPDYRLSSSTPNLTLLSAPSCVS